MPGTAEARGTYSIMRQDMRPSTSSRWAAMMTTLKVLHAPPQAINTLAGHRMLPTMQVTYAYLSSPRSNFVRLLLHTCTTTQSIRTASVTKALLGKASCRFACLLGALGGGRSSCSRVLLCLQELQQPSFTLHEILFGHLASDQQGNGGGCIER